MKPNHSFRENTGTIALPHQKQTKLLWFCCSYAVIRGKVCQKGFFFCIIGHPLDVISNLTRKNRVMDELGHTVQGLSLHLHCTRLRRGVKYGFDIAFDAFIEHLLYCGGKTSMMIRHIVTNETWIRLGRLTLIILRVLRWASTGQDSFEIQENTSIDNAQSCVCFLSYSLVYHQVLQNLNWVSYQRPYTVLDRWHYTFPHRLIGWIVGMNNSFSTLT